MAQSFNLLELVKAQFSNKSAEKCRNMKNSTMVILVVALIFITAFPYINQRVSAGIGNSDARDYPGLGAALLCAAKTQNGFDVENGELVTSLFGSELAEKDWKIIFVKQNPEDFLSSDRRLKESSALIFGNKELLISCPESGKKLFGKYSLIPDFSSSQILKASEKTDVLVLYIQALLFSLSAAEIPGAIIMMILLITVQTVLFLCALSFMLSYSRKRAWDKQTSAKTYGFVSSLKILSCTAFLPALVVSGISYFKPAFGLSLGWVLYSFILGLRAVLIYISRIRGKDTRGVV